MDESNSFIQKKKNNKKKTPTKTPKKKKKKKGTDEQTIKVSVGQKRDRDREPLGS
jgi:hypothetical protein